MPAVVPLSLCRWSPTPMRPNRRTFLLSSAAGIAGLCSYSQGADKDAPSERLRVGAIGIAGQGFGDLRAIAAGGAEVVALCDVDTKRPDVVKQVNHFNKAKFYTDFRKL